MRAGGPRPTRRVRRPPSPSTMTSSPLFVLGDPGSVGRCTTSTGRDPDRRTRSRYTTLPFPATTTRLPARGRCGPISSRTCTCRGCAASSNRTTVTGGRFGRGIAPTARARSHPSRTSTRRSTTATGARRGFAVPVPRHLPWRTTRCSARRCRSVRAHRARPRPRVGGSAVRAQVNGTAPRHGPSFAYPDEQYYETTDVTAACGRTHERVRVRDVLGSTGAGPSRFASRRSSRRSRSTTPTAPARRRAPTAPGVPMPGRGSRTVRATTRATSSSTSTSGSSRRLGHDRVRRPCVGAAAMLGRTGRRAVHPPRRRPRTHIVEARVAPVRAHRVRDGTYVADFGAVIAATPVVEIRARRRGRDR